MPLSDREIKQALQDGAISIEPLKPEAVQPSSVDLTICSIISVIEGNEVIDLTTDIAPRYREIDISESGYVLPPGGFVLGSCNEKVSMGPYCGLVATRSSFARMGLICNLSSYANPGYVGTLPLAIANLSGKPVRLVPDIRMAQLMFLHVGEVDQLYGAHEDRKYLNERGVTPPKQHLDREISFSLRKMGLNQEQVDKASKIMADRVSEAAADNVKRLKELGGR